jgi:hypothetical protein
MTVLSSPNAPPSSFCTWISELARYRRVAKTQVRAAAVNKTTSGKRISARRLRSIAKTAASVSASAAAGYSVLEAFIGTDPGEAFKGIVEADTITHFGELGDYASHYKRENLTMAG